MKTGKLTDLTTLSMAELVAHHNDLVEAHGLADFKPAGAKTFSSRGKAVERILRMYDLVPDGEETDPALVEELEADFEEELAKEEENAQIDELLAKEAHDPEKVERELAEDRDFHGRNPEPKAKKEKRIPIRQIAEDMLQEVVGKDENGHDEGHPYATILEAIRTTYPDAKTTVACLRWYAVRLREEGRRVPARPRAKATAKKAE